MPSLQNYLISQAGQPICLVEATDTISAVSRAKGLGDVLEFSPSLPMTAELVSDPVAGIPAFKSDYFELLGFKK